MSKRVIYAQFREKKLSKEDTISIYSTKTTIQPDGAIFIPGNVPSSKNSKRIITVPNKKFSLGQSERKYIPKLINSELVNIYILQTKNVYFDLRKRFHELIKDKEAPFNIEFTFIRDKDNDWDYTNITQIVQDLMVKNSWIPDDSFRYVKPFYGDPIIDSQNPGVIIKIL